MEQKPADDTDTILRSKQEEILALLAAIAEGQPDIDIILAAMVEGESEAVKLGILDMVRKQIEQREAEQQRQMGLAIGDEQKKLIETEQKNFTRWLVWLMSESTLKKLKLAALIPLLQRQVRDIGEELAAKGVTLGVSTTRDELGRLSALMQELKQREKDAGMKR